MPNGFGTAERACYIPTPSGVDRAAGRRFWVFRREPHDFWRNLSENRTPLVRKSLPNKQLQESAGEGPPAKVSENPRALSERWAIVDWAERAPMKFPVLRDERTRLRINGCSPRANARDGVRYRVAA